MLKNISLKKKMLLVLFPIVLSGCTTMQQEIPQQPNQFPSPPELAMVPPPPLKTLPEKVTLQEVGDTINDNYTQYHLIADQLTNLQEWIKTQLQKGK